MGFSFVAEALLASHLPAAEWTPLITKLGYPVGFLLVILGSQQLFTENTLTPVVPLLSRKSSATLGGVARLWAVVLAANIVGAMLFALVVARTALFEPPVHEEFARIGAEAISAGFVTTTLRAVFAGWLIALMVWMLPAAGSATVLVIIVVTWLVGAAGLAHIIAGSVDVLY